jgi:hypothetical protein
LDLLVKRDRAVAVQWDFHTPLVNWPAMAWLIFLNYNLF